MNESHDILSLPQFTRWLTSSQSSWLSRSSVIRQDFIASWLLLKSQVPLIRKVKIPDWWSLSSFPVYNSAIFSPVKAACYSNFWPYFPVWNTLWKMDSETGKKPLCSKLSRLYAGDRRHIWKSRRNVSFENKIFSIVLYLENKYSPFSIQLKNIRFDKAILADGERKKIVILNCRKSMIISESGAGVLEAQGTLV